MAYQAGNSGGVRPGLVIVGLIVLVFGGCMLLPSNQSGQSGGTSSSASTEATPTSPVPIPPKPVDGPTFEGPVRLAELISFSTGEPLTGRGTAGSLLRWDERRLRFSVAGYGHDGARWGDSTTPSYEQCVAAINRQAMSADETRDMPWRNNEGYCFRTGNRKVIVFARTAGRDGEALTLDVVIWKYQETQPN